MSLHHGDHGQEALFARLLKTSEGHDLNMNCFISGSGDHFFISLMESSTKQEKWAWAGSADSIIEGFQRWLASVSRSCHERNDEMPEM